MPRRRHAVVAVLLAAALVLPAGAVDEAETQINWYGYLKLDMAHDTAVTTAGNYALYVRPHARDDAVSTLSVTGRQARLVSSAQL